MPPRDPPQVSDALARSARELFQSRYPTPLTDEDGREIANNLLGMFGLLRKWKAARDALGPRPSSPPSMPGFRPKRRVTRTRE